MTEIGEEMCQAEVAHHANRAPEFLCSRPEKAVYFYKKALALNEKKTPKVKWNQSSDWYDKGWESDNDDNIVQGTKPDGPSRRKRSATSPNDLQLYESRSNYWFTEGTDICQDLPSKATPEEQVVDMCAWDFFRLVRLHKKELTWYEANERPVVTISLVVKLTLGAKIPIPYRLALGRITHSLKPKPKPVQTTRGTVGPWPHRPGE
jgi:hypothetical protein